MNILLVEDNKDLLEVVSGLLTERGYNVICKYNFADAMNYVRTEKEPGIDIAFIDFFLRGVSSEKLVELITEKNPKARIIMTSADIPLMKKNMKELFERKQIDAAIAKPYDFEILMNLIQECSDPMLPAN